MPKKLKPINKEWNTEPTPPEIRAAQKLAVKVSPMLAQMMESKSLKEKINNENYGKRS